MSDTEIKASVLPEVPKSVDNAIENLTDLPTKGIGQTLSDCWFLAFGGISQLAEKKRAKYAVELQKFKSELETSLNAVPEENRQEPSSQIVLKALDEAKYCVEESNLRELFVKLITSSTDNRKNVHPSFAHIIGQMSPNDAKLLQIFSQKDRFPVCDLKIILNERGSFHVLYQNIFIDGPQTMNLSEKTVSISSLMHLGLLEKPWDGHFSDNSYYEGFEQTDLYQSAKEQFPNQKINLEKGIIKLTSLGRLFLSCCLLDNNQNVID